MSRYVLGPSRPGAPLALLYQFGVAGACGVDIAMAPAPIPVLGFNELYFPYVFFPIAAPTFDAFGCDQWAVPIGPGLLAGLAGQTLRFQAVTIEMGMPKLSTPLKIQF